MVTVRTLVSTSLAAMLLFTAGEICSQTYPSKPIRIFTGSSTQELLARMVGQVITGSMGQPVVVDNRASVVIASESVAKAQPDGYSVLLTGTTFYLTPLTQKISYDPLNDFAPVIFMGRSPSILYVTPSLPVKSIKEIIAYAKTKPGELNDSIGALGSGNHLMVELFKSMAGVNIVTVPYSSGSQETADLISGRLHMTFGNPSPLMEQVKTGKLRALAVTSLDPSALAPGLPPISATLPGYEWNNNLLVLMPAKTPPAIVNQLNREIQQALKSADLKERMFTAGVEVIGNSPEQSAALLKSETVRISKLIQDIGLTVK
jgi:tripartite-type tricarboxylate transporter receptor subunit TctC